MTDREMANAMARGDQAVLLQFVRLYHTSVFQYMRGLTAGREDAEDLAIEAVTHACRKIGSYRGESSLKTWVHRIAYHRFTHWQRRFRPTESLAEELAGGRGEIESLIESDVLLAALRRLPPTLSQPFILHEVSELSLEETASVLEIPVGTVKSRLHYARTKLREMLTPTPEETHAANF